MRTSSLWSVEMSEMVVPTALRHLSFRGCERKNLRPRRTALRRINASTTLPILRAEEPDAGFDNLASWLLERGDLNANLYRMRPMQRRIPACLRALRVTSEEAARLKIERQPELLQVALNALLLGVTEFFRDPPVFEALRHCFGSVARENRPLRVWSASCSIGCELYSVGFVLADLGLLEGSLLWGTDCRADALQHAHHATYTENYLAQLDASQRDRFFERDGACFRVRDPLRSQVQWRQENVFAAPESPGWDAILWRNTAIYMNPGSARSVWNRLGRSIRPGGLLVTGKAEQPVCDVSFSRVTTCIYRKLAD